jgi:protein-S-isoprenylcysteine O-methyltransferase Ste14
MPDNPSIMREAVVLISALIYWGGVVINVYRVGRNVGRSPNLMKYRTLKEKMLSLGWFIIIGGWLVQPLVIHYYRHTTLFSYFEPLFILPVAITGILLALAGYAGTLWCYALIGNSWRLGVNSKVKTVLVKQGIYRFVRHPIYSFQILILTGMTCLLPTLFSLIILIIHYACVFIMTNDEEGYLIDTHGAEYREYLLQTGRFIPKLRS